MKKILILAAILIFVATAFAGGFLKDRIILKARESNVAISVFYTMNEKEYEARKQLTLWLLPSLRHLELVAFMQQDGKPFKTVAYLGSGTIITEKSKSSSYIVTVRHLFEHNDATTDGGEVYARSIYVFRETFPSAIEAEVIATSAGKTFPDDYAVIKTKQPLGPPGLKISEQQVAAGAKIIAVGSTGGVCFNTRFCHATYTQKYFRVDMAGILHLSMYEDFPYLTIYPGGPGDSGGGIYSEKGDLAGIMYCGIDNSSEQYIFANPIKMLTDFLKANSLEWLGK